MVLGEYPYALSAERTGRDLVSLKSDSRYSVFRIETRCTILFFES
jgi:hypothetical protein